jgi:hypothetical protein
LCAFPAHLMNELIASKNKDDWHASQQISYSELGKH